MNNEINVYREKAKESLHGAQSELVMRMFKKDPTPWIDAIGGGTEACFINRLFGLYA